MIGRSKKEGSPSVSPPSSGQRMVRRLLGEVTFIVIVCGALVGAALFVAGMAADEKKRADEAETQKLQLSAKVQTLWDQMAEFKDALPLSKKILNEQGDSNFTLSREEAQKVFLSLKEKYLLDENIQVTISSMEEPEGGELKKDDITAISSTIDIQMTLYSDEQALSYLKDITSALPGIVTVDRLSVSRGAVLSLDSAPDPESQNFNEPKVSTNIKLTWYGFRVKEKAEGES